MGPAMTSPPSRTSESDVVRKLYGAATLAQANLVVLEQHGANLRMGLAQLRAILDTAPDSPLTRRIAEVFTEFALDDAADTTRLISSCAHALRSARRGVDDLELRRAPTVSQPHATKGRPMPVRRARVLVVDDEKLICSAYLRMLSPFHEVVTIDDGGRARALLERDTAFDVVLCDLMMPDVDGPTLFRHVRERDPALAQRFVFCSGGTVTERAREFAHEIRNPILEKPLSREDLLEAVDRHLGDELPAAAQ